MAVVLIILAFPAGNMQVLQHVRPTLQLGRIFLLSRIHAKFCEVWSFTQRQVTCPCLGVFVIAVSLLLSGLVVIDSDRLEEKCNSLLVEVSKAPACSKHFHDGLRSRVATVAAAPASATSSVTEVCMMV